MGFGESITTCFRKTFTYSGRASRSEYWWFMAFHNSLPILWFILGSALSSIYSGENASEYLTAFLYILFGSYWLLWMPTLSASIRRGHDIESAGFLTILLAIPLLFIALFLVHEYIPFLDFSFAFMAKGAVHAGSIALTLFVLNSLYLAKPSDPNTNKYGPNPHEVTS